MTEFIAEICSNHNGDLARALALIEAAKRVGCDGVKFQLFRLDSLFAPELLNHPDYAFVNKRRAWELPLEWLPDLAAACRAQGLKFGCTPFYLAAVDELAPYVDFFKIASYEFLWTDLSTKILTETDKPLMMSCGMATIGEISAVVYLHFLQNHNLRERLTLMHCISQYPARPEDCYLSFIHYLKNEFFPVRRVGYSDHSVNPGVIYRVVHRHKVEVIEFHLDLADRQGHEYSLGHCWIPDQIEPVIRSIKDGLAGDGIGVYDPTTNPERHFRADPSDGLRPMKYIREQLRGE